MDEDRSISDAAHGDDSGIIDLRALAAEYAKNHPERASLPELFAAPSWAPPAPVAMPEHARPRWAAAIAASVTLAVSMVAFAAVPTLIARTAREPVVVAAPAVPAPVVTGEIVTPVEPVVPVVVEPEVSTTPRPAVVDAPTRPRRAGVPAATRPAPSTETMPATGTAPATGIDSDIDRLLEAALSGSRPGATAAETLPATPAQRDVTSALRGLERQVAMCREGEGAIAATRIVIDGATGRVQSVRVTGVDAEASACVSDLVETASFPRFAQDTFTVTFPYRL